MIRTAMIILAAGNSSRLGRPKQLLEYRGRTLIMHLATEALNASLFPVVVVTGAFRTEVSDSLQGHALEIVHNPHWEEGMASGIVAGLLSIRSLHPDTDSAIISVCDQPFVSAALLQQLIGEMNGSGKGIVACAYSDTVGTPVLFSHRYFKKLSTLSGKEGAKKLLKQFGDDLAVVPFPRGNIDIDTEEDYRNLVTKSSK